MTGRIGTGENAPSERIWDEFLTEEDKKVFAAAGYGAAAGFGERCCWRK